MFQTHSVAPPSAATGTLSCHWTPVSFVVSSALDGLPPVGAVNGTMTGVAVGGQARTVIWSWGA